MTLRRSVLAALAALAAGASPGAFAQAFPSQPIRLILPYAAGGSTDNMARTMQEPLAKALGQSVIVENKAGASGIPAAKEVIRSRPDGHTLFFVNNGNLAVTPFVVRDAGYDGVRDFTPIALVSSAALVAVVPASLPVNDLKGFIEYAKAHPLNYASAGVGSFGQLSTEAFLNRAGIRMTHIPYKGQAPTTTAAVSGEVQLLITTPSGAMNDFIQQKRLKLLGVTSAEPSPLSPGAPTIAQTLPGYAAESWFAIIGPPGMPAEVVAKLNAAINGVLAQPDLQERFRTFGVSVVTATPQRLAQMTADEVKRWQPVIRDNNIKAE
jgi:tripartite-type tricarboxylate transporter receptor subunit TctC